MAIKLPYNLDIKGIEKNNTLFPGGFYPVGENNFWHGGIHLTEEDKSFNDINIYPVADGEIIACRITNDFIETEQIPESLTIDDFNSLDETNRRTTKTGIQNIIKKYYSYEEILIDNENYSEKIYAYVWQGNEIEDSDEKILKKELCRYSNNFVLMRHICKTPKEQEIKFYSLYMHLAPWGLYRNEHIPLFFRDWYYKIKKWGKLSFLKLYKNKWVTNSEDSIPSDTIITENFGEINQSMAVVSKLSILTPQISNNNPVAVIKIHSEYLDKEGYVVAKRLVKNQYGPDYSINYLYLKEDFYFISSTEINVYYDVDCKILKGKIPENKKVLLFSENCQKNSSKTWFIHFKYHSNFLFTGKIEEKDQLWVQFQNIDFSEEAELLSHLTNPNRKFVIKLYNGDYTIWEQNGANQKIVTYSSKNNSRFTETLSLKTLNFFQHYQTYQSKYVPLQNTNKRLFLGDYIQFVAPQGHVLENFLMVKRLDCDWNLQSGQYCGYIKDTDLFNNLYRKWRITSQYLNSDNHYDEVLSEDGLIAYQYASKNIIKTRLKKKEFQEIYDDDIIPINFFLKKEDDIEEDNFFKTQYGYIESDYLELTKEYRKEHKDYKESGDFLATRDGYIESNYIKEYRKEKGNSFKQEFDSLMNDIENSDSDQKKITVFSKPIPVTTKDILGQASQFGAQRNIFHLEIFTDNIDFLDNKEDTNFEYIIKPDADCFFKKKEPIKKAESIPPYSIVYVIKEDENIVQIEIMEPVWVHNSKLTDLNYNKKNDIFHYYHCDSDIKLKGFKVVKVEDYDFKGQQLIIYPNTSLIEYDDEEFVLTEEGLLSFIEVEYEIKKNDNIRWWGSTDYNRSKGHSDAIPNFRRLFLHNPNTNLKGFMLKEDFQNIKHSEESDFNTKLNCFRLIANENTIKKYHWYSEDPSPFKLEGKYTKDELDIEDEIIFTQNDIEERNVEGEKYLGFPIVKNSNGNNSKAWVKEEEWEILKYTENKIQPETTQKIIIRNLFNWPDFILYNNDSNSEDQICDISDIIKQIEGVCDDNPDFTKINTIEPGEVWAACKNEELYNTLQRLIVQHPTEWDSSLNDDRLNIIEQEGCFYKPEEKDIIKEHMEQFQWWKDVASSNEFPSDSKNLWYFHPGIFLQKLQDITEIDVRALIELANRNIVVAGGRNNRQLHYRGMDIYFYEWGFDSIIDALRVENENSISATGKSIAENMEYMLTRIFEIASDPDIQKLTKNQLKIGSTFRKNDNGYPGHCNSIAFDLNNIFSWYCNSSGDENINFDKDIALQFIDLITKRHGVTQVLFNCPYVVQNSTGYVNGDYYSHHHHMHIDFYYAYGRKNQRGFLCKGSGYQCPNYNICGNLRNTVDFNNCTPSQGHGYLKKI